MSFSTLVISYYTTYSLLSTYVTNQAWSDTINVIAAIMIEGGQMEEDDVSRRTVAQEAEMRKLLAKRSSGGAGLCPRMSGAGGGGCPRFVNRGESATAATATSGGGGGESSMEM